MCSELNSPLFPIFSAHEESYDSRLDAATLESLIFHSTLSKSQTKTELNRSDDGAANYTCIATIVNDKKLNHNAKERDRRKKINSLFSTLHSLIPAADQTKKLTNNPAIVSRVLKYIPELQQHVEALGVKKKEILSRIKDDHSNHDHQGKSLGVGSRNSSLLPAISAAKLSDGEVIVQISTNETHRTPLSEILLNLEEDGLHLVNASSFESIQGMVFHTLHLHQVEGTHWMGCEKLSGKLLSSYGRDNLLFS